MWLCLAYPGAGAPPGFAMQTVSPPRPWHNGRPAVVEGNGHGGGGGQGDHHSPSRREERQGHLELAEAPRGQHVWLTGLLRCGGLGL